MTVGRRFRPAEGQVHLGSDGRRVDAEDAGVEIPHRLEGGIDVARVDRRRQSVGNAVPDRDRFLDRPAAHYRHHWPEDLLLRDAHVRTG